VAKDTPTPAVPKDLSMILVELMNTEKWVCLNEIWPENVAAVHQVSLKK